MRRGRGMGGSVEEASRDEGGCMDAVVLGFDFLSNQLDVWVEL